LDPGALPRPAASPAGRSEPTEAAASGEAAPEVAAELSPRLLSHRPVVSLQAAAGRPAVPAAREPGVGARTGAATPGATRGAVLSLTGVTVRYGGMVAADAISVEVRPGPIV